MGRALCRHLCLHRGTYLPLGERSGERLCELDYAARLQEGGGVKPVFNLVARAVAPGSAMGGAVLVSSVSLPAVRRPQGATSAGPAVVPVLQEQADGSRLPVSTLARAVSK